MENTKFYQKHLPENNYKMQSYINKKQIWNQDKKNKLSVSNKKIFHLSKILKYQ